MTDWTTLYVRQTLLVFAFELMPHLSFVQLWVDTQLRDTVLFGQINVLIAYSPLPLCSKQARCGLQDLAAFTTTKSLQPYHGPTK